MVLSVLSTSSFVRACPSAVQLLPQCLLLLTERGLLNPNALSVTESASFDDVFGTDTALAQKFEIRKQNRYGVAHILVMTPAKEE